MDDLTLNVELRYDHADGTCDTDYELDSDEYELESAIGSDEQFNQLLAALLVRYVQIVDDYAEENESCCF